MQTAARWQHDGYDRIHLVNPCTLVKNSVNRAYAKSGHVNEDLHRFFFLLSQVAPSYTFCSFGELTGEVGVLCRSLVNDSYRTDLILMYPPFMIALACIYIASVLKERDTRSWFEELRVDMNVVWPTALLSISHVNISLSYLSKVKVVIS